MTLKIAFGAVACDYQNRFCAFSGFGFALNTNCYAAGKQTRKVRLRTSRDSQIRFCGRRMTIKIVLAHSRGLALHSVRTALAQASRGEQWPSTEHFVWAGARPASCLHCYPKPPRPCRSVQEVVAQGSKAAFLLHAMRTLPPVWSCSLFDKMGVSLRSGLPEDNSKGARKHLPGTNIWAISRHHIVPDCTCTHSMS